MNARDLWTCLKWDMRINFGPSWDSLRACLLLLELRLEQFVHATSRRFRFFVPIWLLTRFIGSIYQWLLCNSNIPGSVKIGPGLRLPHPNNIIIAGCASIGPWCTIYQNVSIVWNGFKPVIEGRPTIDERVLIGTGAIVIGDISIGRNVLVGAGAVVTRPVEANSRVTVGPMTVKERLPTGHASTPGSDSHLRDPYSIWR